MSRGIGNLQRQILDTLDDAKNTMEYYRGSAWGGKGWVSYKSQIVRLGTGVYDLRASAFFLARKLRAMDREYISTAFQAAFSRAVKSLLNRKLIDAPDLVPLDECNPYGRNDPGLVVKHADGIFLDVYNKNWIHDGKLNRQARFVVKR